MKQIRQFGLGLFSIFLILLLTGSSDVQADFQFNDFSSVDDLIFVQDAVEYSSRLRLTPAEENKTGAVWYAAKQDVESAFETTFQFQLTGYGQNMPADGFAFVIQNSDDSAVGVGGGWMGFTDIKNSIAIEFDTFLNTYEYSVDHICILTNGEEANSSDHAFSLGTRHQISIADRNIHTVIIRYIPGTLSIYLDDTNSPILSIALNLPEVLQLEEGKAWVGFTAATGGLYTNHDILSWEFQDPPSFGEKPIIDGFPCQTAIDEISFISPQPLLRSETLPVNWSLLNNPEGMNIDSVTGVVQWEHPVKGYYDITISATNAEGSDHVEWQLVVVENNFEDPIIISSKYIDFVVPPHIAQWMEKYGAASYADACWELMRDTIGHVPYWGRQIMLYNPNIPGAGGSGNPAQGGPNFWHNEFEPGWTLGAFVHEVGHNFLGLINIPRISNTGATWDHFFHHGTELMQTFVALTLTEKPEAFINREAYQDYCWWEKVLRQDYERNTQHYRQWLSQGGRAENYSGGSYYHPWGIICREIVDAHGVETLERTIRAIRTDGLPSSVYDMADTPLKINNILFCIVSKAAGADLRDFFDQWGFDIDQSFWETIEPIVADTITNLPNEDYYGWKRNPINGHYYQYTHWPTSWDNSERLAQRLGGHLVTIRSAEEDQWVRNRFYIHKNVWIGYTDQNNEGKWSWISGYRGGYERWNSFEPNGAIWENYAAMLWGPEEGWNDAGGTARLGGVIEVPELPDSAIVDILEDRCIQLDDIFALASQWLTTNDDTDWIPQVDMNQDGIINMMDFAEIADEWLNCENCIYPKNVAEGKIATASSKYEDNSAAPMAVNGKKYYYNYYHSAINDRDPWWMVNLEQEFPIKEIIMWNRLDCCQLRLQDITVEILDSNQSLIYSSPLLNPGNTLPPKEGWTGPEKIVLTLEPTSGQYVRIRRTPNAPDGDPDTYILTLVEVEVLVECQP